MRAIGEVDQLFRVLEGEPGHVLAAHGHVAGIGGGGRVPAPDLSCERAEADRAGPAAVAHAGELPVPLLERQPHLEEDVRVLRRLDRAGHAAERRQVRDRVGRSGRRERSALDGLGRGDGRVGKPHAGQLLADERRSGLRRRDERAGKERDDGRGKQETRSHKPDFCRRYTESVGKVCPDSGSYASVRSLRQKQQVWALAGREGQRGACVHEALWRPWRKTRLRRVLTLPPVQVVPVVLEPHARSRGRRFSRIALEHGQDLELGFHLYDRKRRPELRVIRSSSRVFGLAKLGDHDQIGLRLQLVDDGSLSYVLLGRSSGGVSHGPTCSSRSSE